MAINENVSPKKTLWKESMQYCRTFQETEDPEVLIEFVKSSLFSLKEGWVIEAVMKLVTHGEYGILRKMFTLKRGQKKENQIAIRNLILMDKIDRLVAQGMNKTKVFEQIISPKNEIIRYWNIGSSNQIKKIYYATRKKKPQVYVQPHGDFIDIWIYPARISVQDNGRDHSLFGLLKICLKNRQ
jgi:hypothetical protein